MLGNNNEVSIIVTSEDHTGQGFDSAGGSALKFGAVLKGVGAIAGGFIGGAVLEGLNKAKDFIMGSTEAASNFGESVNAVRQVFKASQADILSWGKNNANSFGLSRRAFYELATPLGAMLKNAGMSMDDTTKSTINLTKRAADMASVFNTDVDEALQAIQAGLRGESDPLEKYGVSLSAARVEAEALAETHKKAAKDLTSAELATARINLIMKQTKDVAGDFANTSDGLANSQRILAARTEDAQATLGQKLLPVSLMVTQAKLKLVSVFTEKLLPAMEGLSEKYGPKLAQLWNSKIVPALKNVWSWIKEKIIPVLMDLAHRAIQGAKEAWEKIQETIQNNRKELMQLRDWLKKVADFITDKVLPVLGPIFSASLRFTANSIRIAIANIGNLIRIFNVVRTTVTAVVGWIRTKFNEMVSFVRNIPGRVGGAFSGMFDGIKSAFRSAINWVIDAWNNFSIPGINTWFGTIGGFETPNLPRFAAGGVASGLIMSGERGRELIKVPAGSRVLSNSDTERALAGQDSQRELVLTIKPGTERGLMREILHAIAVEVRSNGVNPASIGITT